MTISANQFLMLYTWFLLVALLIFTLLIARFYQKFSGARVFYRWYIIPLVLLGVAVVRYTSAGSISGDIIGDLFSAAGGAILILLCLVLYRFMLYGRGKTDDQR
jgi:tellurite resistance protein TehA-like permease